MKKIYNKSFITVILLAFMISFTASCTDNKEQDLNDFEISVTNSENTETESYNAVTAAPKPETEEEIISGQTEIPIITGVTNINPTLICIAGTCEPDAKIYIRGGVTEVSYVSDYKYFIGTVEIPASGITKLEITARVKGKNESETVATNGTYNAAVKQIRTDVFEVIVGNNYQCHFVSALADYTGTNILTDDQKSKLTSNINKNVTWLNENMPGTELIYLVLPNPMTIYPETVPTMYEQFIGEGRTEQFCKAAEAGGAVVINTTDVFKSHKDEKFKLFHKTDSHWTEYGAWLAYTELMNYISQKYPAAVPRTFDEMGFYTKEVNGGDMPYFLELDYTKVRELAVFANPTFESPANLLFFKTTEDLNMNHDTTPKAAMYATDNTNLPNVYVMRDSFGIAMYNMLPDRFNQTTYKKMWSYGFDQKEIKESGTNYVLYLIAERNLGELIY